VKQLRRVALTGLLGLLAAAALATPAQATPRGFVRLSNERSETWSAWVIREALVRDRPRMSARKVALLRTTTFHHSPELVVVIGSLTVGKRHWLYVRYPGFDDRRGWIPEVAVVFNRMTDERLVLDRYRFRLRLLRGRKVLFSTRVGVGAVGSPTPAGRYYIRERLGPFANSNSIYGALAFGTSAFSHFRTDWPGGGQVGVHGTNEPGLIPGRISNGCVRLRNSAVVRLGRLLRVGTPLYIR
jgi:hypothetical protein